ncbi:hypothetical protein HNQ94_001750 [Salirhabdus euzebyi]|uniref:Glycosyltransferase n=1 Tax=Salirhabdus euzebyi TaxID=394506 RepID=A0A841Q4M4_9BACI|nr:glycosyltransferase family 4 protein [Salirhabdus euzebyi]MBB6453302.1 hypothetical protein [Salirhabdus euzebyi]
MNKKKGCLVAMKICMLSSVHDLEDTRIFYKEAKSLKHAGLDVYYVVQHDKEEEIDGIQVIPLQKPKSRLARMTKTLVELYRKAKRVDADMYHFHDPELLPVGMLLKRQGKKVIYDVHEDVPRQILSKYWIPKPFRKLVSNMIERYENKCARKFDSVITATPHIAERFQQVSNNVTVICNYPLVEEFANISVNRPIKGRNICYVGGISKVRGIEEMVTAIGKTDGHLLLAGSFNNGDLRDEVVKNPGWQQVKELGFINREKVQQTLSESVAGLYIGHPITNYVHSLPIKIFEYMAAGIPVIASNFPLLKDIVEGNKCGFCVDPLDAEAIGSYIQWLFDHPEEAKKMGGRGRLAVFEKFNWQQESVKLQQLYEKLAGKQKGEEYHVSS